MGRIRNITAGLAVMAAALTACGDSTGTGDARLTVLLTDAPAVEFDSVGVVIGQISILPDDGAPVVLTDSAGEFDLLQLQDGVTASLAELDIEAGTYVQLRMVVLSAGVKLADGFEFDNGDPKVREIQVPSGAQSGIKINLRYADADQEDAGIEIVPGENVLVVDFDVSQNFKVQGNPSTPAGLKDVKFTPLLRAVVRDVAGSIAGKITDAGGESPEGLTIRAVLEDSDILEALQTDTATATVGSDSTYVIRFLSPGDYTVTVADDTVTATPSSQSVTVGESEDVTGIDFTVATNAP